MIRQDDAVRVLEEVVCEAVRTVRGSETGLPPRPFDPDSPLTGDSIQLKSAELMAAATEVADRFDLRRHGIEDYLLRRRSLADWAKLVREHGLVPEATVTFYSSGSTGQPQPCPHALADLRAEAADLTDQLATVRRVRLYVPPHHIYGFLWGVVWPALADVPVLDRSAPPEPLAPGDLVVSYPDHWAFLAHGDAPFPDGLTGLSSTAPLGRDTAKQLIARGVRLIELYGSSQTAGIGWRTDPDAPFTLMARWQTPAEDQRGADGAVAQLRLARDGAEQEAQDRLEFEPGRRFRLGERRDHAVQVHGINVYPGRVRRLLEELDGVREARVRLDPKYGALSALIVPDDLTALWRHDRRRGLEQHLRAGSAALSPAEQLVRFVFADKVPKTPQGKEEDWTR